jgi:hypothetical protein
MMIATKALFIPPAFARLPTADGSGGSYEWPGLSFDVVGYGAKRRECVYAEQFIAEGTLIPAGGRFITHWEYLAATAAGALPVPAWLQVEDPDPNSQGALWFDPRSENPLVAALHNHVVGACQREAKYVNLQLVWSVFPTEGFSSSSRILYQAVKDIPRGRRLCAPPLSQFVQAHPWTAKSQDSARYISSSLQAGGSAPVGDALATYINGDVGRPDLIYGAYTHLEADPSIKSAANDNIFCVDTGCTTTP